jgi:hypothetical protein
VRRHEAGDLDCGQGTSIRLNFTPLIPVGGCGTPRYSEGFTQNWLAKLSNRVCCGFMENNLASGENGIIKTPKQLLIEAEQKIGQMENERRLGIEHIQKQNMMIANLRIGLTAVATHFNLTPLQVKEIYDKYCAEHAKDAEGLAVEAKEQFLKSVKEGKPIAFTVVDGDKSQES